VLFIKYYYGDQTKEDETGGAYSTHTELLVENVKVGEHMEDLSVDGEIILEWLKQTACEVM
jgi:hypothetical protein